MVLQALRRVGIPLLCVGLLWGLVGADGWASVSSSPPSPDTTDASEAKKYLIRGTTEAQLGDYKEAILYFETALNNAPNSPTVLQALADAHAAQGDLTTALFYARQARRYGSHRAYHHRRLAELQRKSGESKAALRTYRTLLDKFPTQERDYRALASLQEEAGRPEAALDTYRTLLKRTDRPSVAVHRKMLSLHRRAGNAQGIEQALQALVDCRPTNPRYRRLLGEHYLDTDRPDAALDLLAPLAEQYPDNASLQQLVGRLTAQTGRASASAPDDPSPSTTPEKLSANQLVQRAQSAYDKAISSTTTPDSARLRRAEKWLRTALDRDSTSVPALDLLARIQRQIGNHQESGTLLEKALAENPRDAARWTRAATAHLHAHRYDTARSVAEEGLLLFPGHAPLARTAGVASLRLGDTKRAANRFQEALDLLGDSAQPSQTAALHAALGLAYTHLDRPEDATAAFETAQSLAPDNPTVLRNHAYSLALRGINLDRALQMARRAVEQSPSNPYALDALGWVQFRRENLDAARRHLQRALDAGPSSAQILEHFGDVQHALGNDAAAREYWQRALDEAPGRTSLQKKLDDESPS